MGVGGREVVEWTSVEEKYPASHVNPHHKSGTYIRALEAGILGIRLLTPRDTAAKTKDTLKKPTWLRQLMRLQPAARGLNSCHSNPDARVEASNKLSDVHPLGEIFGKR